MTHRQVTLMFLGLAFVAFILSVGLSIAGQDALAVLQAGVALLLVGLTMITLGRHG